MRACIKCDDGVLREVRKARLTGSYKEEQFVVSMPAQRCDKCHWVTIRGEQMGEFGRRVADAYRSEHGLLTSDEIRKRRARLGLSQAAFAKWISVATSTVARWELGLVQDRSMDRLMRLLTDKRELRAKAAEIDRMMAATR